MNNCSRCDGPGGSVTFENQACMPLNGKVQCIDHCIHQIVAALNAGGVETVASCCGHGEQPGRIDLADGRVLRIEKAKEQCGLLPNDPCDPFCNNCGNNRSFHHPETTPDGVERLFCYPYSDSEFEESTHES